MSASENPSLQNSEGEAAASSSSSSTTLKLFGFPLTPGKAIPCGNKRLKCHFCCREFANFQALGGHQNAHKKERQKATLAQFQYLLPHHQRFIVPSPNYPIMYAPGSSRPFVHHYPIIPSARDPQPTPTGAGTPRIELQNLDGDVDLNLSLATIPSNSNSKEKDFGTR